MSLAGSNQLPPLPPRNSPFLSRDIKVQNVEVDRKSHESIKIARSNLNADKINASLVSDNVAKVLASLENTVRQLSERVDVVEKQLSSVAADIEELKAVGGISGHKLEQMSRDGVCLYH